MTKPDDIPQDVWDKAFHEMDCHCPAVMFGDDHLELSVHTAIARAIMAAKEEEREGIAIMIETGNYVKHYEETCADSFDNVVSAIRKREEAE